MGNDFEGVLEKMSTSTIDGNISVVQAADLKFALEGDILALVKKFETETGLLVADILFGDNSNGTDSIEVVAIL